MAGTGVFGYAESDSEDELPPGWEERTTPDGRVFYANHGERATQWVHPRTGKRKHLTGDLPRGWTRKALDDGTVVFVNHKDRKTTFTDPRLAFAIEDTQAKNTGPPRQKFDASTKAMQILHGVDLAGKVVLITGASSGIGFETARCLAIHNAHVFLACRDRRKAESARDKILAQKGSCNIDILDCDLSALASVKQCAKAFLSQNLPLHILILNAGVFALPFQQTTDTRLEMTFAVNHLGHFYLTKLLTPKLLESSPARVIILSSESHRQTGLFGNFPKSPYDLTPEQLAAPSAGKYWWLHAYNVSKLCNIWMAMEFNRRYLSKKVTCNSLHPGNMMSTGLPNRSCFMKILFTVVRPFTKSLEQGASTTLFCAVSPDLEGIGGQYLNNCWFCKPDEFALNEGMQGKLWKISEEIVDLFEKGEHFQ